MSECWLIPIVAIPIGFIFGYGLRAFFEDFFKEQ